LAYLNKKLQRLEKIAPPEGVDARLYWRALALIARAGLIFADHYISSLPKPKDAVNFTRIPNACRAIQPRANSINRSTSIYPMYPAWRDK
jgi:hypothetical protein